MKLTAKLMSVFLAAVVLMTAVASLLTVRRSFERFERRQQQLAQQAAEELEQKLVDGWRQQGPDGLHAALHDLPESLRRSQFRWVWFERSDRQGVSQTTFVEGIHFGDSVCLSRAVLGDDGHRHLHTYHRIDLGDGPAGGLELTGSLEPLDSQTWDTILTSLLSLGAIALLSVLVVYVAGMRWVARPLSELIEKTERIGRGDFQGQVHVRGKDELSMLAQALNEMSAKLEQQQERIQEETRRRLTTLEQLRHADRLKTVGRLAAGLAHELGTPLNVVSGRAGLIASGKLSDDEVRGSAQTIKSETERVTAIIRQLLDFARPGTSQRRPVDVGKLVSETAALLEPIAEKRNVRIVHRDAPGLIVSADRSQLQQVLTNILVNAIHAMPDGGEVTTRLSRGKQSPPGGDEPPVDCVQLVIADRGVGISEENLAHIFEPFFTTKDVGEGTGLGLSIAYGIVQEHGGWIDVESQIGQGSCFTICLPVERSATIAAATADREGSPES